MPRNSMISRVNEKCRICLSDEGSMVDVFTAELNLKIKELTESTSIQVRIFKFFIIIKIVWL